MPVACTDVYEKSHKRIYILSYTIFCKVVIYKNFIIIQIMELKIKNDRKSGLSSLKNNRMQIQASCFELQ